MADVRFRKGNQVKLSYSNRIMLGTWTLYESEIRDMHSRRKTRAEILEALEDLSFHPSLPQLSTQMKKWQLKVYKKQADTPASRVEMGEVVQPLTTEIRLAQQGYDTSIASSRLQNASSTPLPDRLSSVLSECVASCEEATVHAIPNGTGPRASIGEQVSISGNLSETSSMRTFTSLAVRLKSRSAISCPSMNTPDEMSIDSGDSWSFSKVTGMPVSNGSTERLKTPDSVSRENRSSFSAFGSADDLRRSQMSPLLPLQPASKGDDDCEGQHRRIPEQQRRKSSTSLPPIAPWWPLSSPKYEDEVRFPSVYKIVAIYKSSLSILHAFEHGRKGTLVHSQSFSTSLVRGIAHINETLNDTLLEADEWSEDSKLRGDLRLITIYAKKSIVSDLIDAWRSPQETVVDMAKHTAVSERTREEVLFALLAFHYRMEQVNSSMPSSAAGVEAGHNVKSFV